MNELKSLKPIAEKRMMKKQIVYRKGWKQIQENVVDAKNMDGS